MLKGLYNAFIQRKFVKVMDLFLQFTRKFD